MQLPDLIRKLGTLALASRLRRLSEFLSREASEVYKELGFDFESRWFPLLYALRNGESMAVTELSGSLGLSHPAVVQIANAMKKKRLLTSTRDASDERRHLLALSKSGRELSESLEDVWKCISESTADALKASGRDLLLALGAFEQELDRSGIRERSIHKVKILQYKSVRIEYYTPRLRSHFDRLNRHWLNEYFEVEPEDEKLLSDPNRRIVKKGGQVLFAMLGGDVVGTCAVIKIEDSTYELVKMAVDPNARRRQVGRRLVDEAVSWAKRHSARTMTLHTSKTLVAANNLYKKLGFREVLDTGKPTHKRPTIAMKLDISKYKPLCKLKGVNSVNVKQ